MLNVGLTRDFLQKALKPGIFRFLLSVMQTQTAWVTRVERPKGAKDEVKRPQVYLDRTQVLRDPCFSLSQSEFPSTVYNQNFWNQTKSLLARMSGGETASQSNRKQKIKMFTTKSQEY